MIHEDDLADGTLAGMNPEQKFRYIERIAATRLDTRNIEGEQIYDDYDYMSSVLEAARLFGIEELMEWDMPPRSNDDWVWKCRNFRADATRVSQRILFEQASVAAKDPNTVALDVKTKERLRFHLGQMRKIIDAEPIPDWKKENLFECISELESEIDKVRTRLASVLDLIGKALEGSESYRNAARKIVSIIQDAKAAEKQASKLAAPAKPKQLPAPRQQKLISERSNSGSFDTALDDEIPF